MLTHPTLDQLNQLGLFGMAKAFREAETSTVSSVLQFSAKVGFENSLIGHPCGSFRRG
jgi:hypothetical protein